MKGGIRVINLARGGLVNDDAIIAGLESGRVAKYITDFPDNRLVNAPNVIAMPHLGASTPESEANCAVMAAQELRDYLENGNINNSVNLPNLSMRRSGECRICVIHKNVPTILSSIVNLVSDLDINVENHDNKSKKTGLHHDRHQSAGRREYGRGHRPDGTHHPSACAALSDRQNTVSFIIRRLSLAGGSLLRHCPRGWKRAARCVIVDVI